MQLRLRAACKLRLERARAIAARGGGDPFRDITQREHRATIAQRHGS
jgi:hypothetical protein